VPLSAALLLAVTVGQLPGQTLLWREIQNTGHSLVFGILALLTLCTLRRHAPASRLRPLRTYLAAGTLALLCGIVVEVVQAVSGGDADTGDVVRNAVGILIALLACAGFDRSVLRPSRSVLLGVAAALAMAGSWPLASLAWACHQRALAFPVFFDPVADWQPAFTRLSHARLERTRDAGACPAASRARLWLAPVRYAGIAIIEPEPDWRGRATLVLDFVSGQPAPFELVLRIHDTRHDQAHTDRYNRQLTVVPGANRFRIPLTEIRDAPAGRHMDMAHIAGIKLFIADVAGPVSLCIGPLWLE
jgi:hypothetical protein